MPRSTTPRFEDLETLVVVGGNRDWESTARRNQLTGTAGYFTQNQTGRHNLRFGGEALRFLVQETWFSGYPGNVLHVLRSGRPSSVFLFCVKRRRVSAFLDVFNCLNVNPEQNAIWSSGASFKRPLSIVSPRIARMGLNVDW